MSITKEQWEQQYIDRIPDMYKEVFKRAYSGKSKAAGIKARCLDCTNFQRKEVELCDVTTCPLYQYKPYNGQEQKRTIAITLEKKERPKRAISPEHKAAMAKGRNSKG